MVNLPLDSHISSSVKHLNLWCFEFCVSLLSTSDFFHKNVVPLWPFHTILGWFLKSYFADRWQLSHALRWILKPSVKKISIKFFIPPKKKVIYSPNYWSAILVSHAYMLIVIWHSMSFVIKEWREKKKEAYWGQMVKMKH